MLPCVLAVFLGVGLAMSFDVVLLCYSHLLRTNKTHRFASYFSFFFDYDISISTTGAAAAEAGSNL